MTSDDLLTVAEADAIARRYCPTPKRLPGEAVTLGTYKRTTRIRGARLNTDSVITVVVDAPTRRGKR